MQHYQNVGGSSGVVGFEIKEDSIVVQFNTGAKYLYTYRSAGAANIETMKSCALRGYGLNSFINTHVKHRYEKRVY